MTIRSHCFHSVFLQVFRMRDGLNNCPVAFKICQQTHISIFGNCGEFAYRQRVTINSWDRDPYAHNKQLTLLQSVKWEEPNHQSRSPCSLSHTHWGRNSLVCTKPPCLRGQKPQYLSITESHFFGASVSQSLTFSESQLRISAPSPSS